MLRSFKSNRHGYALIQSHKYIIVIIIIKCISILNNMHIQGIIQHSIKENRDTILEQYKIRNNKVRN